MTFQVADALLLSAPDFSDWSADPARPDYACPAYREQSLRWQLVHDAREGTKAMREQAMTYLPRFEAESTTDWYARVRQTFANDHYGVTLAEHAGLVFAEPLKLGEDVPQQIRDLCEDVDGEGNHIDVLAHSAMEDALHFGHVVLYTDYPDTVAVRNRTDERQAKMRPYVTLYTAPDVLSWRTAVVGGVQSIVQIVFRERNAKAELSFGVSEQVTYREVAQDVSIDEISGRVTGLGAITWRTWQQDVDAQGKPASTFRETGSGVISGPSRIPARVIYGGRKLGLLNTKPHLFGLALKNIEETQVGSDYAAVMHKCNVPTPVFIGRGQQKPGENTVQMGQGIDIPIGGSAMFLEPSGVALEATRQRLEDIRTQMRREGSTADESGKVMTAMEAAIYAKQRNAKLTKAARSEQDALEGMLADFAAFMNLAPAGAVKSGGSVMINTEFHGGGVDPTFLAVMVEVYKNDGLTLQELRSVVQTGKLPETFSADDEAIITELMSQSEIRQDAERDRLSAFGNRDTEEEAA